MAEKNSIRCMQLPLAGLQLLLPNSVVAEIISYSTPDQAGDDWFEGMLSWRGVMVPIVSVEGMCQRNQMDSGSRARIAIIYNLSGDEGLPYLGVILQDIPKAYQAEEDRMLEVSTPSDCKFLFGRADMLMEQLMIPDLDAIMAVVKQKIAPKI